MKKYFIFLMFISCAVGHKTMTQDIFGDISVGTTEKVLIKKAGKPNFIKKLESNQMEYEYLETIYSAGRIIEIRRYLFILENNKIISKKMVFEKPPFPVFDRNAYDMQTSEKA
ncbi:MAG: hypothetical protein AMS24_00040 [Chlamydiae bacterium SM23_39]|nr:MAG: hypothetical protein AMS24_00040 [Chlamydiae bacterium SM23_39]